MANKKPDLREKWLKLKEKESKAKQERFEVEEKITEVYGVDFKGGSKTFKDDDGYKVKITKNPNYKMDKEKWEKARKQIPEKLRPEKVSYDLVVKGYNWLKENKPEIFTTVSKCVEYKENRPTIEVTKI